MRCFPPPFRRASRWRRGGPSAGGGGWGGAGGGPGAFAGARGVGRSRPGGAVLPRPGGPPRGGTRPGQVGPGRGPGRGTGMKATPLVELGRAGQSPWIDYIHRGMIASGELARRIAEDGIRGVTSNPTIFEKAVSSGHDYDAQIRSLARAATPLPDAYKAIVTDDIRAAADVLRPVYDVSGGDDGYVSLEGGPGLARAPKRTTP